MCRAGLVHDAVNHAVRDDGAPELGVPCRRRELRAQYQRSRTVAGLDDLHDLARLLRLDLLEQPVVDYEKIALYVLLPLLEPILVLEDRELVEHLGQPGVAHGVERIARGDPQRIGYPGLPGAARARDDDVLPARCPCAVRRLEHLRADIS